jgi:hypothetical protein
MQIVFRIQFEMRAQSANGLHMACDTAKERKLASPGVFKRITLAQRRWKCAFNGCDKKRGILEKIFWMVRRTHSTT